MTTHVLALDLKDDPDLIAEYEQAHAPGRVWPEVIRSIRSSGIREMRILRLEDRLVMLVEADDGFDLAAKARADAADPVVRRWEDLMSAFQKPIGGSGVGKWREMRPIFDLALQDREAST